MLKYAIIQCWKKIGKTMLKNTDRKCLSIESCSINVHLRQSVVHIWEADYFVLPRLGVFHSRQRSTYQIKENYTSCIPCTFILVLTTFVHGCICILKLGNS
jgi:hypothetical protein